MFKVVENIVESDALRFVLAKHIFKTLTRFDGHIGKTAAALGCGRGRIVDAIDNYGFEIITRVKWPAKEMKKLA